MINKIKLNMQLTKDAVDFIDDGKLHSLIDNTKEDLPRAREIFAKSLAKQPLTVEETAVLLAIESKEGLDELFEAAKKLKRTVYGNRIVLFAPLYIGNLCLCKIDLIILFHTVSFIILTSHHLFSYVVRLIE